MTKPGLGPLDETAPSSAGLALELGEPLSPRSSWPGLSCVGENRRVADSRGFDDIGREGSAVLVGPRSRWWPEGGMGTCCASLISIGERASTDRPL